MTILVSNKPPQQKANWFYFPSNIFDLKMFKMTDQKKIPESDDGRISLGVSPPLLRAPRQHVGGNFLGREDPRPNVQLLVQKYEALRFCLGG
jgi:hypothetical protein